MAGVSRARILVFLVALTAGLAASVALWRGGPDVGTREAEVIAPASPQRIICTSPAITELVYAISPSEADRRVVGISDFTTYPPEALDKPSCGGAINPNYELILSLQPDLVITQGAAEDLAVFAQKNGMSLLSLELTDLDSILAAIEGLGSVLGLSEQAEAARERLERRLDAVRARHGSAAPVPLLLVVGREMESLTGIFAAGPGGFLDDVIGAAGGRNVCSDLPSPYAVVNREALIEKAPEVIVELHGEGGDEDQEQRLVREAWTAMGMLPAVRHGRVYVVTSTYALIPGPRVVELVERLAALLHPEAGDG
jgi:iron complex transport system substrate-binding protein